MTDANYESTLAKKQAEYENICKRCGRCCGAYTIPCANLVKLDDGTYTCKDYENRLGQQVSVEGKSFFCIEMRELIKHNTAPPECAYYKTGK